MVRNEICPECKHDMLDHVLIGPRGNGCQAIVELDGGHLPSYCGCDYYDNELLRELTGTTLE